MAQDLVNDTFFALWRRRTSIQVEKDIRVYLASAVRNRARNARAHTRVVDAVDAAVSNATLDAPAMSQSPPSAEALVEAAEFRTAYTQALATLDEREREAVLLRWEEGFTLAQVAEVLGLSIVGARKVILRAQAKVQRLLEAFGPTL